jgi:hypothetical protein
MSHDELLLRLSRIEEALQLLISQRTIKEYYTPAEVAELLSKSEFTVREWCRLSRIHAEKRACGRGSSQEWMISQDELQRIRSEGLLPNPDRYYHVR